MTATLSELLQEAAGAWPERVAVSEAAGGRAVTYRELEALAPRARACQRHRGQRFRGRGATIRSGNSSSLFPNG